MARTQTAGGNRAATRRHQVGQIALVIGLVAGAVLVVAVADRVADTLVGLADTDRAWRSAALVSVAGKVLGGWAVGMALRLHLLGPKRKVRVDPRLRWGLGVPAGLVCGWPLVVGRGAAPEFGTLPWWADGAAALELAGFVGVVLGLVLAQGVRTGRRR